MQVGKRTTTGWQVCPEGIQPLDGPVRGGGSEAPVALTYRLPTRRKETRSPQQVRMLTWPLLCLFLQDRETGKFIQIDRVAYPA
jgi:hypothetical protein